MVRNQHWHSGKAGTKRLLARLGIAVGMFSAATAHPGLPTLLPCLATATLIHVGATLSTFGRLLGCPPLAGIGLISDSICLWHWPLLTLWRDGELPAPDATVSLIDATSHVREITAISLKHLFSRPSRCLFRDDPCGL